MNGDTIVCHTGVIQAAMKKGVKRVHRFVTLPDYQGIGIGRHFIDFVAAVYKGQGLKFNLITTTPALRFALERSDNWFLRRSGHVQKPGNVKHLSEDRYKIGHIVKSFSCDRVTYSFDYIGDAIESDEIKHDERKVKPKHDAHDCKQLELF